MAVTAAIVGLGLTAAGAAEGAHQHHVANVRAGNAARKQEANQQAMQKELQMQQAKSDAETAQEAQQAGLRQRSVAAAYRNSSGGFSTSPLGLPGDGNTAKGGLLGL